MQKVLNLTNKYGDYDYYFGVVKANGYGHGYEIIDTLIESGINYLAVADIVEAMEIRENYKDIPILMITARSQEEDKIIGEETGANEYITKPFNVDYVVEKVKSYLG